MTIIKVKQSIIDKVGVRCTRRAGNTSGQCHCRTPTWHAYIHDLTSYRLLYSKFTTVSKVELVGMPWCL